MCLGALVISSQGAVAGGVAVNVEATPNSLDSDDEVHSLLQHGVTLLSIQPTQDSSVACKKTMPLKGSNKEMPAIGFGTCCRPSAHGSPLIKSTEIYLGNGGRLIDTAQKYNNHKDLAIAIRDSGIPREELWVTSKVDTQETSVRLDVVKAVNESLRELDLEYLDSMLLHGGTSWGAAGDNVELWRGLIAAKKDGMVKNIGVSNYNQAELEELEKETGEAPAVIQIEYNPWASNETTELVNWCKKHGVMVMAYNVLGGSSGSAKGKAIAAIANKYGSTNAQVLIRWILDQGIVALVGATSKEHILQDLNCSAPQHLSAADSEFLQSSAEPADWFHWDFLAPTTEPASTVEVRTAQKSSSLSILPSARFLSVGFILGIQSLMA